MKNEKMNQKKRILTGVMLAVTISLTACGKEEQSRILVIEKEPYEKVTYNTITVMQGDLEPVVELTLRVENFERINYTTSQENLEVEKVHVNVGDKVKKGDVLVSFKSDDIQDTIRQYRNEKEEKELLVRHYSKLMELDKSMDYQSDIDMLQEDIRIADLYITEAENKLKNYNIVAEKSGTITYISDVLASNYIVANTNMITQACGSGGYTASTWNTYDFKTGDVYEAVSGIAVYEMKLVEVIEEEEPDGQIKKKLRFEPISDMSAVSEQEQLTITIQKPVMKNVVYVKKNAVYEANGAKFVYVVDENGYRDAVQVETADEVDGYIVITKGLSGGEKVTLN